ncbi:hypothetical protein [Crossiella cryophila]
MIIDAQGDKIPELVTTTSNDNPTRVVVVSTRNVRAAIAPAVD